MAKSVTIPNRENVANHVTTHICLNRCFGAEKDAAGCCRLDGRDYILGPIPDAQELLARLREKFGRPVMFDEIFIGHAEGSKLFPDRPNWQKPENFPALRVDTESPELPCRFLLKNKLCGIHDIRSVTCRNYYCPHLKGVLDAL